MSDKTIGKLGNDSLSIRIKDTSYTDATTFKNSLSGVYLIYELETPTTDSLTPFTEVQECDNWGTEEWLAPTTDTRPCEVPVGHETDYLPDLKAKLEVAPSTPNENGVYVMEHDESGNSYTPIATWLQANGYVNEISANAIKENIGGSLRHQLAEANNIDFDNTAWVDLGTLTWYFYQGEFFTDSIPVVSGTNYNRIICPKYKTLNYNLTEDKTIRVVYNGVRVIVSDSSLANLTTTQFTNAMKGILLAYEKAS
jgi:hypothetical protein